MNETDAVEAYRELAPPPALRGALECLWMRVVPPDRGPIRVLPDGCTDLIWRTGQGAFVAGPDTGPKVGPPAPGAVFVGARFLPGAGGPALRIPLDELRDARVQVDLLWPELSDHLAPTLSPPEAFRRIAATAARLVLACPPDRAVREAARRLGDPRARIETLADDLGLSERQLRRRCHAAAGYGPKTLQRVLRFRRFLARADAAAPDPDLLRIAFEAGYADQAHLTRECTRLAGMPPVALARVRTASYY